MNGDFRIGPWLVEPTLNRISQNGVSRHLEPKVMQVLVCLSKAEGQVVPKQQLIDQVWKETIVTDDVLTRSISELRKAFGDDARDSKIIQSIPKQGYRLVASIKAAPQPRRGPIKRWQIAAASLFVAGIAGFAALQAAKPRTPVVIRTTQLTTTPVGLPQSKLRLLTDGLRLYFVDELSPGRQQIYQVSASGGQATQVPIGLSRPDLWDISADGSELLLADGGNSADPRGVPVYVAPVIGGSLRRLGTIMATAGAWSPDGSRIALCRTSEGIYVARRDGSDLKKIAAFASPVDAVTWSPDGKTLRFSATDVQAGGLSHWEVSADGGVPRQLLPGWNPKPHEHHGSWSPAGNWFVFHSARPDGDELWAMRESTSWLGSNGPQLARLTSDPIAWDWPVISKDGKKIYAIGNTEGGYEIGALELATRRFRRFLPDVSARGASFSPDGQWLTYVSLPTETIWISRADSSDRRQLTTERRSYLPRFSPDGKRIVFAGRVGTLLKVFIIAIDGGSPEPLVTDSLDQFFASWSPDGKQIALTLYPPDVPSRIAIVNVASRARTDLSGSEGLEQSIWSPNGRYIAGAAVADDRPGKLFDLRSGSSVSLPLKNVSSWAWSQDSNYIYFKEIGSAVLKRIHLHSQKVQQVAEIGKSVLLIGGRVAPDGSPMLQRPVGSSEVYALELEYR